MKALLGQPIDNPILTTSSPSAAPCPAQMGPGAVAPAQPAPTPPKGKSPPRPTSFPVASSISQLNLPMAAMPRVPSSCRTRRVPLYHHRSATHRALHGTRRRVHRCRYRNNGLAPLIDRLVGVCLSTSDRLAAHIPAFRLRPIPPICISDGTVRHARPYPFCLSPHPPCQVQVETGSSGRRLHPQPRSGVIAVPPRLHFSRPQPSTPWSRPS